MRGGKRKGAGRKPRPGGQMRHVGFRADAESRCELARVARSEGKSLSAFIRDAVLRAVAQSYVDAANKNVAQS